MDETTKNSILIVDDENLNIMALTHILGKDYTIYVTKNGRNAIAAAEKYLPDLILLDVMMPEMDGYEVIAALKSSGATKSIPVIFITGLSDSGDEEKGLSLGGADYIGKPFSPTIVKLRVNNQMKIINQTRLIIEKETAEKSSRARSEFLSRISHEMRTPMNAIIGMTSLAKGAADTEKRDEMLDKIKTASGSLLKVIDGILDMSDIEDGKFRLADSEFSFSEMMSNVLSEADAAIQDKRQSFTVEIDPSIPDRLVGDGSRLARVISELLSNAAKFTPESGEIRLDVSAGRIEGDLLTLKVVVADSGIGMSEGDIAKLFIPFEQADGGIDRKFGGAGLGLSISGHIVDLMGGAISVESRTGKGSTFGVTVNIRCKAPEKKENDAAPLAGRTAMIVDDIEINREIVIAMLEDTGMLMVSACDGREALEMFASEPARYDAIIMDVNMPGMDGLEATRRIRALDAPEGARVPIIAMTANVLASEVDACIEAGMTAHVGKPVDFVKLTNLLEQYM